ncbi:MAG: 1-pyrroline-5-carboxylate dehydrogenase [Phycisphaerae bacterium]|nr:1-pyrroline-5-carboxylate dehydrogenase [Phycisphaerae bacterium]
MGPTGILPPVSDWIRILHMALFRKNRTRTAVADTTGHAASDPALEARIQDCGRSLLEEMNKAGSGMLSTAFWSDKLMDWAMKDEAFKVQLFRFIDTFPSLKTPKQVHEHLVDYLSQPGVTLPPGLGVGLGAGGLLKGAMSKMVSGRITAMAGRFIAGTDAASALPQLKKMWDQGIGFTVDLLGEACVSCSEAEVYQQRYMDLVETLPREVGDWKSNPVLETDHLGPVPRTNVSIKISSLYARTDPIDFEGSLDGLVDMIGPILERAGRNGVLVNFDMEHHAFKDLTLSLFERCCETYDFEAGLALQAYLRSGDEDARRIIEWSKATGRVVTVRLVKGAYWDEEIINADMHGWPEPVWSRKRDTDACFERMTHQFIEATPREAGHGGTKLALGSHNVRSLACGIVAVEEAGLPMNAFEVQMLRGMNDQMKQVCNERGLRIREYVPVGEMIPGMAYLVRRLLENTSNESWLRGSALDTMTADELLASPHGSEGEDPGLARAAARPERHALSDGVPSIDDGRPFFTEPMRDFSLAANRENFAEAIGRSRVPSVENTSTLKDADKALAAATSAFPAWRDREQDERSAMLVATAAAMRTRRDELSGVLIRESGKTWREADADVCEAIDFCEYYARQAFSFNEHRRLGRFMGELDLQFHEGRGVAVVISPWNFPLAICMGMTAAALVTGNTVIVKPAEQTPGIARIACDLLWAAGVPREVLHFLPGEGETVGAALVRDPRVSLIAFTGSKAVGLDIVEAAGSTPENQPWVKRVVCEMGGKNAIIVDASADLDEAVLGVRDSAFNYQGQKCSACSRAIVVESAWDTFIERLVASTESLVIGDPLAPGTDIGPVIDQEAADRIEEAIAQGHAESTLAHAGSVPQGLAERVGKPFIAPHIFVDAPVDGYLATREIFGPVLALLRARDFDHALQIANMPSYKLTGGVYSRMPSHLERATREFRVGNLYLNRSCTGALVGRQPFGGFGMSGIGSKAGGGEYLSQFVVPRALCENTMRRGFAPGM